MPLCFECVTHLHSSIEASDCRVDEASDDSVQDEGQNLKRVKKKDTFSIKYRVRSHSRPVFTEKWLSSLINEIHDA